MAAMKELDQAIETLYELVTSRPGSLVIEDAFKQVAETYGTGIMTVMFLYNDWVMANNLRGVN